MYCLKIEKKIKNSFFYYFKQKTSLNFTKKNEKFQKIYRLEPVNQPRLYKSVTSRIEHFYSDSIVINPSYYRKSQLVWEWFLWFGCSLPFYCDGNTFKSFTFSINYMDKNIIYQKELWPKGLIINRYFYNKTTLLQLIYLFIKLIKMPTRNLRCSNQL